MNAKNMEFIWRASPSLGPKAQIFSGAFQSGNYGRQFAIWQHASYPRVLVTLVLSKIHVDLFPFLFLWLLCVQPQAASAGTSSATTRR